MKLIANYPYRAIPLLPEKHFFEKMYSDDSAFVEERMNKLQHFLSILVSHPIFHSSDAVKDFLVDSDEFHFNHTFEEESKKDSSATLTGYLKSGLHNLKDKVVSSLPDFSNKRYVVHQIGY